MGPRDAKNRLNFISGKNVAKKRSCPIRLLWKQFLNVLRINQFTKNLN